MYCVYYMTMVSVVALVTSIGSSPSTVAGRIIITIMASTTSMTIVTSMASMNGVTTTRLMANTSAIANLISIRIVVAALCDINLGASIFLITVPTRTMSIAIVVISAIEEHDCGLYGLE